jgi:hypothetical protein
MANPELAKLMKLPENQNCADCGALSRTFREFSDLQIQHGAQ